MTIQEYMTENKLSVAQFAKKVGVHYTTVYRWINGDSKASGVDIEKVVNKTKGEVTASDLLSLRKAG